ncbi:MAG: sugar transferase [Candidatus Endonucleobacter sp. (ex Gigantidas childressi)]|nr:sugar transferase [Candidatus Endonucleobacter sp. (ex Gigantidas childressi)]
MYKYIFKGFISFISALVLLIIFIIPFMIVAILIKLDSKGSVLYRQTRIGRKGNSFEIFKLRTMVSNADQTGVFSTAQNDSRITKVGAFLRKTSLDELPQILNILLGDMSLIGPRPDVPAQEVNYTKDEFIKRHQVLPGITGLAQSRNRHNLSNSARKRYDIFYNNNIGFILDIRIIFYTLKALKKGSY